MTVYMQVSMMMVLSDSWVERLDEGRGLECLTADGLGRTAAWGRQRPEAWEEGELTVVFGLSLLVHNVFGRDFVCRALDHGHQISECRRNMQVGSTKIIGCTTKAAASET